MIRVPGKWPKTVCGDRSTQRNSNGHHFTCNRAKDHTGRHYWAWYDLGGLVRAVWENEPEPTPKPWEEIFNGNQQTPTIRSAAAR